MKNNEEQTNLPPSEQPAQPEPKELTPEEKVRLEKQRKVFKNLHDVFTETGIFDAEGQLGQAIQEINAKFQKLESTMTVRELSVSPKDDKLKLIIDTLSECTLSDATAYCDVMINAISHHKFWKTKEWKVKDLEIKLL